MEAALVSPSTAGEIGDERIQKNAQIALVRWMHHQASVIDVSVADGLITLRGRVTRFYHKQLAQEAIKNLDGVVDVVNRIRVVQSHDQATDNNDGSSAKSWKSSSFVRTT